MPQRHIVFYFFFFIFLSSFSIVFVFASFFHGFFRVALQLKAFYVDLIVPLESNIEKDTKVVQVRSVFRFIYIHERTELLYSGLLVINIQPKLVARSLYPYDCPNGRREREREGGSPFRFQRSQHNGQSFSALCERLELLNMAKLVHQIGSSIALTLWKLSNPAGRWSGSLCRWLKPEFLLLLSLSLSLCAITDG